MSTVRPFVYSGPNGERAYAPHCNASVLHAPGVCEFCDEYPDWQKARESAGMAFSPTNDPWPGNRPEGYAPVNSDEVRKFAEEAGINLEPWQEQYLYGLNPHIHHTVYDEWPKKSDKKKRRFPIRPYFEKDAIWEFGFHIWPGDVKELGFAVGPYNFGLYFGRDE